MEMGVAESQAPVEVRSPHGESPLAPTRIQPSISSPSASGMPTDHIGSERSAFVSGPTSVYSSPFEDQAGSTSLCTSLSSLENELINPMDSLNVDGRPSSSRRRRGHNKPLSSSALSDSSSRRRAGYMSSSSSVASREAKDRITPLPDTTHRRPRISRPQSHPTGPPPPSPYESPEPLSSRHPPPPGSESPKTPDLNEPDGLPDPQAWLRPSAKGPKAVSVLAPMGSFTSAKRRPKSLSSRSSNSSSDAPSPIKYQTVRNEHRSIPGHIDPTVAAQLVQAAEKGDQLALYRLGWSTQIAQRDAYTLGSAANVWGASMNQSVASSWKFQADRIREPTMTRRSSNASPVSSPPLTARLPTPLYDSHIDIFAAGAALALKAKDVMNDRSLGSPLPRSISAPPSAVIPSPSAAPLAAYPFPLIPDPDSPASTVEEIHPQPVLSPDGGQSPLSSGAQQMGFLALEPTNHNIGRASFSSSRHTPPPNQGTAGTTTAATPTIVSSSGRRFKEQRTQRRSKSGKTPSGESPT